MFYGYAARAMARFAIDQWQARIFRDLVAVDRMFEIRSNLVVSVTACQTVLITDVIGIEIADQKGFVTPDRCYRL
jgi:hypothetical protein